ncbi:type VII secretion protein EccB [Dactylosporangium sp. AC04546]|uniref:type VII secretion protein EccB n=1 Tax=Dactylosporangium sp. AC04546 TaxID=2862460 RepID=UPI001EDF0B00|nr:type VII secretion protein EccB [Dactylosporangium sp. AC04546]WVK81442.1 type VII secretion protein EccB [Dactylosporangium sp. AC04546]
MVARYEQVRAYRFVTRRIVSAMLSGEPESNELPVRRLAMSIFGSVIVGAIVLAVAGVYGFINPSGGSPDENDIVIERESGARFVFIEGTLHPVLNFTSARLIVGSAAPKVRTMSHKSLSKLPVGLPVGIQNAPDPPPPSNALVGLPWSVCGVRVTGAAPAATRLEIGRVPAGGVALGEQAVLVSTSSSGDLPLYLLWHDRRLRITERTVLTALELASATPLRVNTALLNSITAGPDLAPLKLPGAGQPSSRKVAGQSADVGSVYRSGQQYYVLTNSGLATIGAVSAALLLANGASPVEITAAQAAQALSTGAAVEPEGFPQARPQARADVAEATLCAHYTAAPQGGRPQVTLALYGATAEQLTLDPDRTTTQSSVAQQVSVPQGRGALVHALPAPDADASSAAGTVYLVSDQGVRYALQDSENVKAMVALGYEGVAATGVPASLLALIPQGPALDPAAARSFVTTRSTGSASTPTPKASQSSSPKPTQTQSPTPSKPPSSRPPASGNPSASRRRAAPGRRRSGRVDRTGADQVP